MLLSDLPTGCNPPFGSLCPTMGLSWAVVSSQVGHPPAAVPQGVSTPARVAPSGVMCTCSGTAYLQPTVHPGVSLLPDATSTGITFEGHSSCGMHCPTMSPSSGSLLMSLSVSHPFSSCLSSHTSSPAPHSCLSSLKIYEQQNHTCSSDRLRFQHEMGCFHQLQSSPESAVPTVVHVLFPYYLCPRQPIQLVFKKEVSYFSKHKI